MARLTEIRTAADCLQALRKSTVLYAIGADADPRHCRAMAQELAEQLPDGVDVAMVSETDLPQALELVGLRWWNMVAYVDDGRAVLAWPLHATTSQLAWLVEGSAVQAS